MHAVYKLDIAIVTARMPCGTRCPTVYTDTKAKNRNKYGTEAKLGYNEATTITNNKYKTSFKTNMSGFELGTRSGAINGVVSFFGSLLLGN